MPKSTQVHVCLVSNHLEPNLIPVLAGGVKIVCAIVSGSMAEKSRHFRGILERDGVTYIEETKFPSSNLPDITERADSVIRNIAEVAGRADNQTRIHVVLNLTGGNKLMAFGFMDAARRWSESGGAGVDFSAIYVDTATDQLERLLPTGRPAETLRHVLNLETCLKVRGYDRRGARSDDTDFVDRMRLRRPLTEKLVGVPGNAAGFFSVINALIDEAMPNDLFDPDLATQTLRFSPDRLQQGLLQSLSDNGLIRWTNGEPRQITFVDGEKAQYLHGRWLEEYAWLRMEEAGLKPQLGVEVVDSAGNKNEFDVLAACRNRMMVVECKAGRLSDRNDSTQNLLHKIENLGKKVGGLYGTTLLLAKQTLPPEARQRALAIQGLTLLEGDELTNGLEGGIKVFKKSQECG